jgi:hypothetical protein
MVAAPAQYRRHLRHRLGQHDHQRALAIRGQPIGFIGTQAVGMVDHALARHDRAQRRDDRRAARDHPRVGLWHAQRHAISRT